MKKNRVWLKKIIIENLGCVKKEEFEPGPIAIRFGRNAVGKSTGLKAIRAALAGGNHREMIRHGCDQGSVLVELDNQMKISKTFFQNGSPETIMHIGPAKITNPATLLKQLGSSFALNILAWLQLKDDEKGKLILESMPLEIDQDEMIEGFPNHDFNLGQVLFNLPDPEREPLQFLDSYYKQIFAYRGGINSDIRKTKGFIDNLKGTFPDESDEINWNDRLTEAEGKREKLLLDLNSSLADEKITLDSVNADLQLEQRAEENKIGDKYDQEIKALEKAIQEKQQRKGSELLEISAAYRIKSEEAAEAFGKKRTEIRSEFEPKIETATSELEEAKAKAGLASKMELLKKQVEEQRIKLSAEETKSEQLTEILKCVTEYRQKLLATNPIKGLEMIDGKIFVDKILLSELNTARLIELSLELAAVKMADSELRVIFIDNLEALDAEHRKQFFQLAAEKDLQVIGAEVSEGELEIKSE
jgi:hypothetical protein